MVVCFITSLNFIPTPRRNKFHALQKVIMQSKRDGALRDIFRLEGDEGCLDIVNDFYSAVQQVFEQDWFLKDGSNRVVGVQNPERLVWFIAQV